MRNLKRALVTGAIGFAVSASASAQFSNIYFFGDSLTDAGFYGARFTVNPGLIWAQDLGQTYGFVVKPSNQTGTDYAQGGARTTLPSSSLPPGFAQRPVSTQIDEILKATPALDPNALYNVWIGANDLQQILGAAGAGQITAAQAATQVITAATQTAQQVARLSVAGARYIVVPNLPDLGKTPGGQSAGPANAAAASQLTGVFNSTLATALAQSGIQVIPVNIFAAFNEILANPTAFGFTNISGVACTTPSALNCTTSTLVSSDAASKYVFADAIHPTPAAHLIIAQVVNSMITGPQQMAALGTAPFDVEQANYRALDSRMWSSLNTARTQNKFEAWAAYDYGNVDVSGIPNSGTSRLNTITVGGDMKLSDKMLIGAMFGYSENKGDFGGAGGGYKLKQPVGTIYAGYGEGPWYLGATLGAGGLEYDDVNRNIALGAMVRNENGDARGNEYTGRLLGGYWFASGNVLHGPYARVTYTRSDVHSFAEKGSDSTALIYAEQRLEQLLWSAGWQVAGNIGNVRPYARATWEYDSINKDRTVSASSVTLGGLYSVPVAKPDNNYALFSLGASADLGAVTGYVAGEATASRSGGNYYTFTIGIRAPL